MCKQTVHMDASTGQKYDVELVWEIIGTKLSFCTNNLLQLGIWSGYIYSLDCLICWSFINVGNVYELVEQRTVWHVNDVHHYK